ncbi:MAG: pirin family protein [Candidatus Kapaibacteriota bacterium]|jgi:redox-sensitive bicupin YhaK (pirin superfamily)
MSFEIYSKPTQIYSEFNDGEVIENKPIGFPHDKGPLLPYSCLFYWSNLSSPDGCILPEHTHQGFEIFSYVVRGEVEHFNNVNNKWLDLNQGDAQIIKAGEGIVHSEKMHPGSQILQIWFNPDLKKTLLQKPSYKYVRSDEFESYDLNKIKVKVLITDDSEILLDTLDVQIKELHIFHGNHSLNINPNHIYSLYLTKGGLEVNGRILNEDDFMVIKDESILELTASREVKLITVESTSEMTYKTYAELYPRKYSS